LKAAVEFKSIRTYKAVELEGSDYQAFKVRSER